MIDTECLPSVHEVGWAGLACAIVSSAVESWCMSIENELQEKVDAREE